MSAGAESVKGNSITSRRMGLDPPGKLLLRLSLPAMIGMFMQSTYNLVDTIFVGRIGGNSPEGVQEGVTAITALVTVFPIQLVLIAMGVGTGIGVASSISRLLGRGDRSRAITVANNAIMVSLVYWVVIGVLGYFLAPHFVGLFVEDEAIIAMGGQYLRIIMLFSGSLFFFIIAEKILQAQGNTITPMIIMGGTAVLNIALDPVLIFGFRSIPAMGVEGAAVATVISRSIGSIAMLAVLLKGKNELPLSIRRFRPNWKILGKIYRVGGPSMTMQLLGSVMLGGLNLIFANISMCAVAVLGLFFKIQSFIMMPIFGLVQGYIPVVGYNYGADNHGRVKRVTKIALFWGFVISAVGFLLFMAVPGSLISVFSPDELLVSYGAKAFRRIAMLYFLTGPIVIISSFFQATGKGGRSLFILLVQRVLVLLPVVYLLYRYTDMSIALWLGFPISTAWAFLLAVLLLLREMRLLFEGSKNVNKE